MNDSKSDLKKLRTDWEQFITQQTPIPQVDPLVANSWRRCQPLLHPQQRVLRKGLSAEHLLSAQVTSFDLLSIAQPIMEDMHQYIEDSDTVVLLVNGAGYVLLCLGDAPMLELAERSNIKPGALIAETEVGTNAFALALLERVSASVVGAEHYLEQFHGLAEVAAPIFDLTGRRLGALGVITRAQNYHPHTFGLVVAGARAIEAQRQSDILLAEQNHQLAEMNTILAAISEGILVWKPQGVLMHANAAATRILHLPASMVVGRPAEESIAFPAFIEAAIRERKPLNNVEAILTVKQKLINCVVSLRYVANARDTEWVVATFRPAEDVRQLVQHQVGAQVTLSLDEFVGESTQVRQLRRLARSAALAHASVLIRGEIGTGKNYLARAIHNEGSRRDGPFIIHNCASVPNELVLSELLGYEAGVSQNRPDGRPSLLEIAHGGTLLCQGIESLPLEAQAILLNVIDLGIVQRLGSSRPIRVDVRVIATSSANLEELVGEGSFRADLFYRLSPFAIKIPPLRDRLADLSLLVAQILKRLSDRHNRPLALTPQVLDLLKTYAWPGNLRELETALERAVLQAGISQVIGPMHFPDFIRQPISIPIERDAFLMVNSLDALEREAVIQAALKCQGNLTQMSKLLGIGRTTVWRKMKGLNLSPEQFRHSDATHSRYDVSE
jgi:transcriptional activator for dhaKLM operon